MGLAVGARAAGARGRRPNAAAAAPALDAARSQRALERAARPARGAAAPRSVAEAELAAARREVLPGPRRSASRYTHSEFTVSGDNPNTLGLSLVAAAAALRSQPGRHRRAPQLDDAARRDNDAAPRARRSRPCAHEVRASARARATSSGPCRAARDVVREGGMLKRAERRCASPRSRTRPARSRCSSCSRRNGPSSRRARSTCASLARLPAGRHRRDPRRGRGSPVMRAVATFVTARRRWLLRRRRLLEAARRRRGAKRRRARRAGTSIRSTRAARTLDFIKIETVAGERRRRDLVTLTGPRDASTRTTRSAWPRRSTGAPPSLLVKLGRQGEGRASRSSSCLAQVGQLQADAQKAHAGPRARRRRPSSASTSSRSRAPSPRRTSRRPRPTSRRRSPTSARTTRAARVARRLGVGPGRQRRRCARRSPATVVERNVLVGQEVRADADDAAASPSPASTRSGCWPTSTSRTSRSCRRAPPSRCACPPIPARRSPGTVGHIGDVVDPTTRTVKIRCVVPNPEAHGSSPRCSRRSMLTATGGAKVILVPVEGRAQRRRARRASSSRPRATCSAPGASRSAPRSTGRMRVLDGLQAGREDRHRRRDLPEARDRGPLRIRARPARCAPSAALRTT